MTNIKGAYMCLFYVSWIQFICAFPLYSKANSQSQTSLVVPIQKEAKSTSRSKTVTSQLFLFANQRSNLENNEVPIQKNKIEILYESENVIAINKPPHIQHHNDDDSSGIMTIIRQMQLQDDDDDDDDDEYSFPYKGRIYGVHRLDRVTSGILIFAKNEDTAKLLTQAFREKTVVKYYMALSAKKPRKQKQGWVKGDMTKGRRGSWKLQKTQKDPAITRFYTAGLGNVLEQIKNQSTNEDDDDEQSNVPLLPKTAILFQPHTGRTHQLRVAAKSLGIPILGDPNYSDGVSSSQQQQQHEDVSRTFLHAVAFHVDLNDEQISIVCPPKFGSELWTNDNSILDDFLMSLFKKHCNSQPILNSMP